MTKTNQKIPEGWSVKKLRALFSKSLTKNKNGNDLPVLTNSATQGIVLQDEYFDREIVTKENLSNYYCVENGDFIYNPRISKSAPAGPIRRNHFKENGCISPLYTIFKINSGNYPPFYEIYFESNLWVYEAYKVANYGARSDRMNITDEDFFNIKLPVPPLPEQEKIAEILGTWDTAIEKLSALIEQKKQLKKGLMQRLLTGKQRLPGFSAPWKKFEFDAIFYTEKGIKNKQIQTKEYHEKGLFPIVDQGKEIIIAYTDNEEKLYKDTPVIVFGDHTRILKFITFPFVIGADGTQLIKTYSEYSLVFCFYVLQNISIPNLGYSRHMSVLKEKVFNLPPLSEQKAIADILSKADEEITLLTGKLSALKTQKTGLMQKLLTGQIRVKAA